MDKNSFTGSPDVQLFADWLSSELPSLRANLNLQSTRFVPGGLCKQVCGIESVLQSYIWTTDWEGSKKTIAEFKSKLTTALDQANSSDVLSVCENILDWGGDRDVKIGAAPFLNNLHSNQELVSYLKTTKVAFSLSKASTETLNEVRNMNSMLTKVHAFVSDDGLQIYDSRVAAAIASLYEIHRRKTRPPLNNVPIFLRFPAIDRARRVDRLCEGTATHGNMNRNTNGCTQRWCESIVRLGWLSQMVLEKNKKLFADECDLPGRMHAFEASLFMLGYDVTCLRPNL